MASVVPLDPAVNPGFLKLDLYCRGLRLHESCTVEDDGGRPVMRARAGLGSGLELVLDAGLYVNVPVVSRTTFYSRAGHLLPYLAAAALIGLVVLAFLNRRRTHTDHLDGDKEH